MDFLSRVKNAWNVFTSNKDPTIGFTDLGGDYYRPDMYNRSYSFGNDKTIITAILSRIAVDAAMIDVKHVRLDDDGRYLSDMDSGLNGCLTLSANLDQSSIDFMKDAVFSMLDEGCVAIVPIDTDIDPDNGAFDILSLRVARIEAWYPEQIRVSVYNQRTGKREERVISKKWAAIITNPFYAVMNNPMSVNQRLVRKLALMDIVDNATASGKWNMIIQMLKPIKTEAQVKEAKARIDAIESQLRDSPHGVAYTDATEKITQLNRPLDSNLLAEYDRLKNLLFEQLSVSEDILNGKASEQEMLNYYSRTIEPILKVITTEMKRKFLTKTARTQGQSIEYFKDPFKLVPISQIAQIADRFTQNEILTANEVRQIVGMKPAEDPGADELRNKMLYQEGGEMQADPNAQFDEVDAALDELERGLVDGQS